MAAIGVNKSDSHTGGGVVSRACQSAGGIWRVLRIAQNLPPIANIGGLWDPEPLLVGVPNGVLNLETGRLRHGRPEDMLTLAVGVPYDPHATCPRWHTFLQEIFAGDEKLIRYIRRALGYSLTGLTTEQVWWLLYGDGGNGKSTFQNVVKYTLGTYARTIPFNAILLPERQIPDDLAGLPGKVIVFASEAIEGRRLNEGRIKALTGGDPFPARHLYGAWFEFKPTLKLWLSCNHLPVVSDSSYGFWRRVHVVPFTQRFDGAKRDPGLERTLIAEAEGILRWMVLGARSWLKDGLQPPDRIVLATQQYQEESDHLADFLSERCDIGGDLSVNASELYGQYSQWAESCNLPFAERLTQTAFGRQVGARFERAHRQTGRDYLGLGLRRVS